MDVVRMGVGINLAGNGGDNVILLRHLWKSEM